MFGGISKKRLEHVDIWDVSLYQASFNFLVTAEGQPGGKKSGSQRQQSSDGLKGIEWNRVGHSISGNLLHNYGKSP
jgi:hypothetical protein